MTMREGYANAGTQTEPPLTLRDELSKVVAGYEESIFRLGNIRRDIRTLLHGPRPEPETSDSPNKASEYGSIVECVAVLRSQREQLEYLIKELVEIRDDLAPGVSQTIGGFAKALDDPFGGPIAAPAPRRY